MFQQLCDTKDLGLGLIDNRKAVQSVVIKMTSPSTQMLELMLTACWMMRNVTLVPQQWCIVTC